MQEEHKWAQNDLLGMLKETLRYVRGHPCMPASYCLWWITPTNQTGCKRTQEGIMGCNMDTRGHTGMQKGCAFHNLIGHRSTHFTSLFHTTLHVHFMYYCDVHTILFVVCTTFFSGRKPSAYSISTKIWNLFLFYCWLIRVGAHILFWAGSGEN